jgi:D-alanyl-D-alanine dipeptidase
MSFLLLLALAIIGNAAESTRPADIVDISTVAPSIVVRMMYSGSDNFVGRPIKGYQENRCWLTKAAAEALARAEERLELEGRKEKRTLLLEVRDCYRPHKATEDFVDWSRDREDEAQKAKFYPDVAKSDIIRLHYLSSRSAHSRASTVDLTIVEKLPEGGQVELDMGTRVDFLGQESHLSNSNLSPEAKKNRELLQDIMEKDFKNYSKEWWHFTLRKEPYPRTFFDFNT